VHAPVPLRSCREKLLAPRGAAAAAHSTFVTEEENGRRCVVLLR
jgi:hypothetical protein